ncbi:MAG: ABC transporter permease [Vicinamibacterales bacterium]
MRFPTLVLRNLLQRPTRSLLTIGGIAIGVAAVVALTGLAWGFESTWARVYTARGTDLVVIKSGSLSPVPSAFSRDQIRGLETLPGVTQVACMLSDLTSIEDAPVVLLSGWERQTFIWNHLDLVSGRWPGSDQEREVLLGTVAQEMLGKGVGATVQIESARFTVVGIFESPSLAENGSVVMTLPQLQRVLDQPGKINFVNLTLAPGASTQQIADVRRAIVERWPGFKVFAASQVADQSAAIVVAQAMAWATSSIAVVLGAVGVMNTVMMSVAERVHEIGILLALGWRRRRVLSMILGESLALSVAGGATGVAGGSAVMLWLQHTAMLRGKIEGELSLSLMAMAFAIAIGLGIVGGLYPAYRAASMRPGDALRHV